MAEYFKIKEAGTKIKSFLEKYIRNMTLQMLISISFTVLSFVGAVSLGVSLYQLFNVQMHSSITTNAEQLLNQTAINLESYLRSMRLISDTVYYSVIKEGDIGQINLEDSMKLLYDSDKDNLVSIACYYNDGNLLASAPLTTQKEFVDITKQDFFVNALGEMENFHFSIPHVQNSFINSSPRYYWVVTLSRAVEITVNGRSSLGVLVIDTNYSSIEKTFDKINNDNSMGYTYLCDNNGQIIYHPKRNLINTGLMLEDNELIKDYPDGTIVEDFNGEKRLVTVKTVSYTGWKIVNVTPEKSINIDMYGVKYLVIILICVLLLVLNFFNEIISRQITRPLNRLTKSIEAYDRDNMNQDIYVGGSGEVMYLGNTVRQMVERLRGLMEDIVIQQEEKRKTELDALQSQINPHFLYNTLDSIVWMIEGEQYEDAIFMITQLASLFRISLSKGKNIITIEDELKHAQNYMNIQKHRYKDMFEISYDINPEIMDCATVKLVVQPILENALYYGVEAMNGDGELEVRGLKREDDIYIEIHDNGPGMRKEILEALLTADNSRIRKKGSGVGLINVHNRIKLQFGSNYGLDIKSEPDRGTCVTIHLPCINYQEYIQQTAALNSSAITGGGEEEQHG